MVMEKTTSKTSSLQALLLRAWRERWTDLQWGINIKTVLPRGVSGDVYNLADCILQQAVVGDGANQLVLSYLRHSLSAQLVSHAAVLQRLSKYSQFGKVHCITSLLEFLEGMLSGVTCFGKPEETVLATAVLSIALWLLNILHNCSEAAGLIQKASELLKILLTDDFYISMICLAKYNDPELFQETSAKCTEVLSRLPEADEVTKYVAKLEHIDIHMLCLPVNSEKWPGSLVQCWLEVNLMKKPDMDASSLADQLQIFQRLKGFSDSRLFAELLRGSLLCFYNTNESPHDSRWEAITFLKVPHIIQELAAKSDSASVVNAIELILQNVFPYSGGKIVKWWRAKKQISRNSHGPLLDLLDAKCSYSSLKYLLEELVKLRLISEPQAGHLLEIRKQSTSLKLDNGDRSKPRVVVCAETTFSGIINSLSTTEYHKVQEGMLGMFQQMLIAKNFQLILAAACSLGQLKTLVKRLIRFNECFNFLSQDKARIEQFDISFVMLVSIVQNFGVEVLDTDDESLIYEWVNECLVDRHMQKSPTQLLQISDPVIVEALIKQFNSCEGDFKPNLKHKNVLFNMPGVMHEVLVAWEQGALHPSDVKRILDAVRGKMCCLAIAGATYLCSYMRTVPQENLLKPKNMVQQLLQVPPIIPNPTAEEASLRDRWELTSEIIRKIERDIQLPTTKSSSNLMSRSPATECLHSTWNSAITNGWLDYDSARILHCLLDTAGPKWLVNAVIHELLKLRFREQLQRAVDLALAIFHVDIVACTTELLSHILPQLLFVDVQSFRLVEPQLSFLACLTSYCIYTAWDSVANERDDEPPMKMLRFENVEEPVTPAKKLIRSLLQLFSTFEKMEGGITPQTYFVYNLIKSLVEVKIQSANAILAYISPSLISGLLKTLPDLFSFPLLLHLHDVCTTTGRVNMAKDLCVLRNYQLKKCLRSY
ncbi:hypothetical protein D910_10598 [Dendroctonus ponderosae]|uniref:Mediator of RNA polymerase II transcription subunit 24 n=1 Tax=Dendroctonus ponderosae TaxID=77166 RepID=U4UH36_DENPD|nr:hypothetical protein D910_10598 [Dendroctonus ponderosae]